MFLQMCRQLRTAVGRNDTSRLPSAGEIDEFFRYFGGKDVEIGEQENDFRMLHRKVSDNITSGNQQHRAAVDRIAGMIDSLIDATAANFHVASLDRGKSFYSRMITFICKRPVLFWAARRVMNSKIFGIGKLLRVLQMRLSGNAARLP
jgi:hypothetical protein